MPSSQPLLPVFGADGRARRGGGDLGGVHGRRRRGGDGCRGHIWHRCFTEVLYSILEAKDVEKENEGNLPVAGDQRAEDRKVRLRPSKQKLPQRPPAGRRCALSALSARLKSALSALSADKKPPPSPPARRAVGWRNSGRRGAVWIVCAQCTIPPCVTCTRVRLGPHLDCHWLPRHDPQAVSCLPQQKLNLPACERCLR